MTNRCTWLVPSQIWPIPASRIIRSTGRSRV